MLKRMFLPESVLQSRVDVMPVSPLHETVWHLCRQDTHMGCAGKLGQLAMVTLEPPEIPHDAPEGMFLMRLHPLKRDLQPLTGDMYGVWLPAAVSFRHATVWQACTATTAN